MFMKLIAWFKSKQPFTSLWKRLMSRTQCRFRRMFVLTSIHASLVKCSEDDLGKLNEVNEEFKLARHVKVLRFPTLVAPLIWNHIEDTKDTPTDDVWLWLKKIPAWLQYGNPEEIERDVRHMLDFVAAKQNMMNAQNA